MISESAQAPPAALGQLHRSVMSGEVVELLGGRVRPRIIVDGTVGLGGHAVALLESRPDEIELYVAIDRDAEALGLARERLRGFRVPILFHHGNYTDLARLLDEEEIPFASFILLDLGVSTFQLKTPQRGFAFSAPGPLDMRMDPSRGPTAAQLLERASAEQLEEWLRAYGEVRGAGRIARVLYERRFELSSTTALAAAVLDALRISRPRPGQIHPATQVFQALRIAVNRELEALDAVLPAALECLEPGGRMAVISFHSLEDRRVKQRFENAARGCLCPPRMPVCGCGHKPTAKLLTKRALQPSEAEVGANPPSRSARLRAVEKL